MFHDEKEKMVFAIFVFTIVFLLAANRLARSAPTPTVHHVDYLEATVCGRPAVMGGGEDEVAVIMLEGRLGDYVNRYCVPNDKHISVYVPGKVTGVMRNGENSRVLVDGELINDVDHEIVSVFRFEIGNEVLVRVSHASRKAVPVFARSASIGEPQMHTARGKRAMEIIDDYKRLKAMEASNGR